MPQGLLAQWQRGVALRGVAGAGLLMVPVAFAGAIGLGGGIAGGLTSFANGPSLSAVSSNGTSGGHGHHSSSLDSLVNSISPVGGGAQSSTRGRIQNPGGSTGTNGKGSGAVSTPPSSGGGSTTPAADGSSSATGSSSPTGESGIGGVAGSQPTGGATGLPSTGSNPIGQLLQTLLGGGQQQGSGG